MTALICLTLDLLTSMTSIEWRMYSEPEKKNEYKNRSGDEIE